MRTARLKEKRRTARPAAASVKRVVVDFPTPLLARAERVTSELAINRSELIRTAVEHYLEILQQQKLARELADGYRLNAELDRAIGEEFAAVDYENL